jgi:hypothetical protein
MGRGGDLSPRDALRQQLAPADGVSQARDAIVQKEGRPEVQAVGEAVGSLGELRQSDRVVARVVEDKC